MCSVNYSNNYNLIDIFELHILVYFSESFIDQGCSTTLQKDYDDSHGNFEHTDKYQLLKFMNFTSQFPRL